MHLVLLAGPGLRSIDQKFGSEDIAGCEGMDSEKAYPLLFKLNEGLSKDEFALGHE